MLAHLWTGAPPPHDLIIYRLAEKFNKLPHEIEAAPWRSIQKVLTIMDVEARVKAKKASQNDGFRKQ